MQPIQFHATGHPADAGGIGLFGGVGFGLLSLGAKCISGMHSAIREPGYTSTVGNSVSNHVQTAPTSALGEVNAPFETQVSANSYYIFKQSRNF